METDIKKKILKIEAFILFSICILSIILLIIPIVYWFFEPELTKMELVYKFWYFYIIPLISLFFIKIRLDKFKHGKNKIG